LANSLAGKQFRHTDSTVGVAVDMLEVSKVDLVANSSKAWKEAATKDPVMSADTARKHATAQKLALKGKGHTFEELKGQDSMLDFLSQKVDESNFCADDGSSPNSSSLVNANDPQALKEDSFPVSKMDQVLSIAKEGEEEAFRFSIWDYAGQEVFYNLHHLYLTRYSVYMVVFNMEWLTSSAPLKAQEECLDYLRFWLNSISIHAVDRTDQSISPIFLIGTHKDVVSDGEKHDLISKLLREKFSGNPAWHKVNFFKCGPKALTFYPVDNTLGSSDPVIGELRNDVQRCVSEEAYVKKLIPFEWMQVMDQMQQLTCKSTSLGKIVELSKISGLPSRDIPLEKEIFAMLKFYHELGLVMHHEEILLRELVVLDPSQFLIVPATKIICCQGLHDQSEHEEALQHMPMQYQKLCSHGVLDCKLLKVLWRSCLEYQRELERLMVKYGLMVPILEDEARNSVDLYLVPSRLPEASKSSHGNPRLALALQIGRQLRFCKARYHE